MRDVGLYKLERDTTKYFKHLAAHLPRIKDPTLLILRGHLLVEELLDEILETWLKNPNVLIDARLTFYQKMKLAQGITSKQDDKFTWKPIELLNQLRNKISHKLSPHDLEIRIEEFLRIMYPDEYDDIPSDLYSKSKAMRKAIILHCAYMSGRIDVMKLFKNEQSNKLLQPTPKSGAAE
ncbi:MAG: hypothetical protein GC149_06575 [Gammaproteobacteria bacterium]|nr:hypothetical protein [Gammaproteobacteria bacterium]